MTLKLFDKATQLTSNIRPVTCPQTVSVIMLKNVIKHKYTYCMWTSNLTVSFGRFSFDFTILIQKSGRNMRILGFDFKYIGYCGNIRCHNGLQST